MVSCSLCGNAVSCCAAASGQVPLLRARRDEPVVIKGKEFARACLQAGTWSHVGKGRLCLGGAYAHGIPSRDSQG